ncbi:glycoside hydrolase family 25 protein [Pararhizobium sp.]|uniref:glycoside hydrolase family 25 protein n=1 Tax=Pararhizobium sp. TaxID=1977563 RepID=UPI002717BD06|nr:GH25 family lysozyme [Pararhizobium sp.]MDO9417246.1 GH25 family lysozyme [Pararhizobium sp.]
MRSSVLTAILVTSLSLSACAGSDPQTTRSANPSSETTSSVKKSGGPVPSAEVGETTIKSVTHQEELAWSGEVPGSKGVEAITETETVTEIAAMPVPFERPAVIETDDGDAVDVTRLKRGLIYSRQFRDAKPINFGKASPRKMAVHGVDVSRWQGEIDWAKLRTQGANFAYIKATDGGDHLDPMFRTNWKRAKAAGIRRGAYHFFYWCRTAGEQADWFIRNVPREAGALPPVIDVEYNGESSCKKRPSPERVREKMQVFMDKLERHYGQRPIIYTAPDFYADNLRNAFENYPFWLRSVAAHPSKRYPGRKWLFWQYSGSGLSHGVDGRIDLNVFNGSEAKWHSWVAKAD